MSVVVASLKKTQFDAVNTQFKAVHDRLDAIEKQTIKTNGRVTDLEKDMFKIRLEDKENYTTCPNTSKIDKMNEDLMEYKMTKKYPSDIGYLKTYNSTYLLSKGDKVKNPWCFTFTFRDNHLSSNLSKEALIALSEQKDIGNLFKFSGIELQKMIKNGM